MRQPVLRRPRTGPRHSSPSVSVAIVTPTAPPKPPSPQLWKRSHSNAPPSHSGPIPSGSPATPKSTSSPPPPNSLKPWRSSIKFPTAPRAWVCATRLSSPWVNAARPTPSAPPQTAAYSLPTNSCHASPASSTTPASASTNPPPNPPSTSCPRPISPSPPSTIASFTPCRTTPAARDSSSS